ncbi:MAG: hypothetical protein M0R48_02560 [Candidatus Omnitrophica bacterium]|jgi:hypothetical protein|nr:hypothetical protein [Candidatus Omnitrophota bacterium]
MSVFIFSLLLTVTAFVAHFIVWKIRPPVHQKSVLIFIFSAILLVGLGLLSNFRQYINLLGVKAPQELYEYFQICIFFISISLAYMVTYSALEADSPSLVMIMTIANSGNEGLTQKNFEKKINNDSLIMPRLKDILSEKLAYLDGDIYKLTSKGHIIARIFITYRKIVKRERKGG